MLRKIIYGALGPGSFEEKNDEPHWRLSRAGNRDRLIEEGGAAGAPESV
jgi:hypothetical protein